MLLPNVLLVHLLDFERLGFVVFGGVGRFDRFRLQDVFQNLDVIRTRCTFYRSIRDYCG